MDPDPDDGSDEQAGPDDDRSSAERPDPEVVLDAARRRLAVFEDLLRSVEMTDEVLTAVRASSDAATAARALTDAPFGFSSFGAWMVLDSSMSHHTAEGRRRIQDEVDELRLLIDGGPSARPTAPPVPAEPRSFNSGVMFRETPPERFVRFISGPDDELAFAGGTVRVIGVEVYESSLVVQWRHVQDPQHEVLRSFGSAPRVFVDDVGTEYVVHPLIEPAPGQEEYFGRLKCYGLPPTDARHLLVEWGNKRIAVPLTAPRV